MSDVTNKDLVVTTVRWIARLWGILNTVLISVFVMGNIFGPGGVHTGRELLESVIIPTAVITGMILGWVREGLGGTVIVVSLVAFYVLFLTDGRFPGFVFALAAAPGFLFLIAWVGSRKKAAAQTTGYNRQIRGK
ncbi:MAG: DUF7670 domain-containing protein [Planctomycetota bacterium]|jgi:hypothetical protein